MIRRFCLSLCVFVSASAAAAPPVVEPHALDGKSGVVLDADSGQPIIGAFVVERWFHTHIDPTTVGPAHGGNTGRACALRLQTTTDAQGHFSLSEVSAQLPIASASSDRFVERYQWGLLVYAPGYAGVETNRHQDDEHPNWRDSGGLEPIRLKRDSASASDRALNLAALPMKTECAKFDPSASLLVAATQEAFNATCRTPDGWSAARALVDMRLRVGQGLPELPAETADALQSILQRNQVNTPINQDDATQACALIQSTLGAKS